MSDLFPQRLKQLREEQRMRQTDLAEAIGVVAPTVSVWERGVRKPDFPVLVDLADRFGVTLQYLLGQSDERHPPRAFTEEELEETAAIEDVEQLKSMASMLAQLSNEGREIVQSTLKAVYKIDRRRGFLNSDSNYEISIKKF